jgi:hypothetical protein
VPHRGYRAIVNQHEEVLPVTDPNQLQQQALQYAQQGQAATANLVQTLSENWANAVRTATGVGSGNTSPQAPAEVIDRSFDFTIQMLEQQRAFAHQLLEAGVPAVRAMEQATDSVTEKAQQGSPKSSGAGSGKNSSKSPSQ